MKSYKEFLLLEGKIKKKPFNKNPNIGWWLDNDPITFYHGTHIRNIDYIEKNGLKSPKEGPTAGWISLALEPNTAYGYASMSGAGGESEFRSAGHKAITTKKEERVVFIIKLPKKLVLSKMGKERGAMQSTRTKLINKNEYESWNKTDQEYYALTEIRMPNKIDTKFIKGYMVK